MKETETLHWMSPNIVATNSSGFTALPCGSCYEDGTFTELGYEGYWWSSTERITNNAYRRSLHHAFTNINGWYYNKSLGFSVRCMKD